MVVCVSWASCLCIHVSIFAWYVFTQYHYHNISYLRTTSYGGKWKYLTFLNLVLQTVFFGLCVLTDVVHLTSPARSLRGGVQSLLVKLRDDIFTIFAFPYASFVFSSFWPIYAIDRELVYPKVLDSIIPPWLNHALHTAIVPLVLVQMYIQNHAYSSRLKCVSVMGCAAVLYMSGVVWVHHASGIWAYPILAKLSPLGLFGFFGACAGLQFLLYLLGEKLSGRIWGNPGPQRKMC